MRIFSFLIIFLCVNKSSFAEIKWDNHTSAITEFNDQGNINIYNAGFETTANTDEGHSLRFRTGVDGKLGEIKRSDFSLGPFIKELNANLKFTNDDAVIILSLGKMPTGAKIDQNSPTLVSGVMGIRLSIRPDKISQIQKSLSQSGFQIQHIDITRYNGDSGNHLNLSELNATNMTSTALYISQGLNFQAFYINKTPDNNYDQGITSNTLGAAFISNSKLKPQYFAMKYKSSASYMDFDLVVLSGGIEVTTDARATLTYSRVNEYRSQMKDDVYDLSISQPINSSLSKLELDQTFGARLDRGFSESKLYYYRIGIRY